MAYLLLLRFWGKLYVIMVEAYFSDAKGFCALHRMHNPFLLWYYVVK